MGFSVVGFMIAAAIFAPNLLYGIFPPVNMPSKIKDAGLAFTVLERIGQVGCLLLCILKENFDSQSPSPAFFFMLLCIAVYWGLWVRYFMKGRNFSTAFQSLGFIPIPMALFPAFAFAFAALWGKSLWLGLAVLLFSVGHFANSWSTRDSLK